MLILIATGASYATHLRAADIIVERECGSLTFMIRVIAYLNSSSATQFGTNSEVLFGDGSSVRIPLTQATLRPDLGINISVAEFSTTHTFIASGIYTISYIERDRSGGILNIEDSDDVPYVTSITINTASKYGCNKFPVLQAIPLDRGCSGAAFYHNAAVFDSDGDSLSFEMSTPASDPNTFANYSDPNHQKFYTDFNHGNQEKDGPPLFEIDSAGLITWDAPGMIGEYAIAFKTIEWRKDPVTNRFEQVSVTVRDMQIIIEECNNSIPRILLPRDVCIMAGETVTGLIKGTDAENHQVKIEVLSETIGLTDSPAEVIPETPSFVSSDRPAEVLFRWQTSCTHVRQQPYRVVFKITDNPPEGPKLVSFATWTIRVLAPPPVWENVLLNVVDNSGVLKWKQYSCGATKFQIWRKVGSFNYSPPECKTGIPANSGYHLIDEVNGVDSDFIDTNFGSGLIAGALYCYRLVALVSDTRSVVSDEFCIGPVKRDAPVITHVSVVKTSQQGETLIRWTSPLDINREQFPEPYEYEIYRAENFYGELGLKLKTRTTDTTFVDIDTNTRDSVYNYRVVLYSKPVFSDKFIAVDTSAVASSVRLTAIPGTKQIHLQWQDSVPWSNIVFERPYHLIYRGEGFNVNENELVLIDSVNVIEEGFHYTDTARANVPFDENTFYSYKIVTQGTYGNPVIPLQKNFSQMVSLYPVNNLKPCAPHVSIESTDCSTYVTSDNCNQKTFNNRIAWTQSVQDSCRVDIVSYNIYAANDTTAEFKIIASTTSLMFDETDLPSPQRCYKVSSVDSQGHESSLSESFCQDTCPYFSLPNVFTPNNDGCNDFFTSYMIDDQTGSGCRSVNNFSCPRFVKSVNLRVFNRWGKLVYQYTSANEGENAIHWDGKDGSGKEWASGIYYYIATVEFYTNDPKKQNLIVKNWVHLVR